MGFYGFSALVFYNPPNPKPKPQTFHGILLAMIAMINYVVSVRIASLTNKCIYMLIFKRCGTHKPEDIYHNLARLLKRMRELQKPDPE